MNLSLLLATGLVLVSAFDDTSEKKDKLVGRWICTQLPGLPKDTKASMRLTFSADGKLTIGIETPGVSKMITGTWKLGTGDKMTFENLSEPLGNRRNHDQIVTIKDRQLSLQDTDGTIALFKKE